MVPRNDSSGRNLPTIYDVAAKAGVSKSTVSRVLRGDTKVSEDTRERVREAAAELSYVPTAAAQTMRATSNNSVGLLLRNVDTASYSHLNKQLHLALRDKGYHVVQETVVGRNPDEEAALQNLMALRVQAVIVASGTISSNVLKRYCNHAPVIVAGRDEPDPTIHNVAYSHAEHGRMIIEHLYSLGHRHIVIQTVPFARSIGSYVRTQAGLERAHELGMSVETFDTESSATFDEFIEEIVLIKRPSAIACLYDTYLIEAMRVLKRFGLYAPDDISLIGSDGLFDGVDVFGVSTLRLPVEALARDIADATVALIEGEKPSTPIRRSHTGWILPGRTAQRI